MILVIGDPHFKLLNERDTSLLHQQTVQLVIERKPDFVVILGDVYHDHERVNIQVMSRVVNWLDELASHVQVYVLVGNHDRLSNKEFLTDVYSLKGYKHERVTIVWKTLEVTLDRKYVFVPYVDKSKWYAALLTVDWADAHVIFAHQEFRGAMIAPSVVSVKADSPNENHPVVVSGHEHFYHLLRGGVIYSEEVFAANFGLVLRPGDVLYPGTPFQENFGEDTNKGIVLFDQSNFSYERIKLKIPLKLERTLQVSEVPGYCPPEDVYLKITIQGLTGEMVGIMNHPNVCYWKTLGHVVIPLHINPIGVKFVSPVRREDNITFLDIVKDNLQKHTPEIMEEFRSIFGNIGI